HLHLVRILCRLKTVTGITISLGLIPILRYTPPALFRHFHHHLIPPPALLNNCFQITKWKQKGHFVRIL
ncbi:hypothetical protein RFE47_005290, partial [Klebsiella pneumoniae]